jgi:NADH dehydrogenase
MKKRHIIIAGAGFGGIRAARKLNSDPRFKVTLISDGDAFRYYPALYATATGHTSEESVIPLDEILKPLKNITFIKDRLTTIDSKAKTISGASGTAYSYDYLIMALGVVTSYFGIEGLEQYSFGIKSPDEINALKKHLHDSMLGDKKLDNHYIIVGGGPTGVELASSMVDYIKHFAQLHGIVPKNVSLQLVEAAPRILPRMTKRASKLVKTRLEECGVRVMTNMRVERATADSLFVNGKAIKTKTVIWTSGVSNSPFFEQNAQEFRQSSMRKVAVDPYLQALPNVYVIGDNATTAYSGMAQTALYDADFVVANLKRQIDNHTQKPYSPKKPPVVVPVGKFWAIFEWEPFTFGGWIGAFLRRMADLIGYADIMSPAKALKTWFSSAKKEHQCAFCTQKIMYESEK